MNVVRASAFLLLRASWYIVVVILYYVVGVLIFGCGTRRSICRRTSLWNGYTTGSGISLRTCIVDRPVVIASALASVRALGYSPVLANRSTWVL